MRKIFIYIFLILIWCNFGHAETWSCVYQFDNESRQVILERKRNKFYNIFKSGVIDTIGQNIVKETNNFIHLYQHIDVPKGDTTAFLTLLDKTKKSFVMVGLKYNNSTAIIEGKCTIF